jgi:hypothetical protein
MYEREYNEKDLNEIIEKCSYEDCYSMSGIW